MNAQQIIQKHPVPWRYFANGGDIVMVDGNGKQVELLTMLDFVVLVTAQATQSVAPSESEMSSSAAL